MKHGIPSVVLQEGLNAYLRGGMLTEEHLTAAGLFSPQTQFICEHLICSLPAWGRGGAAAESQYWTCVGGQRKLLIIHIMALLSATS